LIPQQLWQTFLEPLEYLNIRKVFLGEPSRSNDPQLRLDGSKALRPIADHDNSLLYRTPSYFGWSVDQLARIKLSRTRYAE
jgi:hypothetical protein